jgi:Uma2 family endonuclease
MLQTVAVDPPLRILLGDDKRGSLDAYLAFCRANPDLRVERTAEGEIIVMPPAGYESSFRNAKVTRQLDRWAERDGRGTAADSSAQFLLPDGSALSPDAAWVSNKSLARLTPKQRTEFPALTPEFIVEVRSPSDRLKTAKAKMEQWIANGVQLAWLIDGDAKTVYIYRPGRAAEIRRGIQKLAGEGPVAGFVLDLRSIWKGLR